MNNSGLKNIIIGIFVIASLAVIAFMLLFLHPSVGDQAKTLHVRFADVDKVTIGTRVTFAGRPVGEVVAIKEIPDARAQRPHDGDIYMYELTLKVDSGVSVYNSDEIILRTSGLLGERNVEINPMPAQPGQKLQNVDNQVLYASQTGSIDAVFKQFGVISHKIDQALEDVHEMINEINKTHLFDHLGTSINNIVDITNALNQPERYKEIIDNVVIFSDGLNRSRLNVDVALQNIQHLIDRFHSSWTNVDETVQMTHNRLQNSWNTIDNTLQNVNNVSAHIANGNGTVGELLVNDDFYLRLKSLLHKGETIMNDINSYGLLFQQDKRWQRLQAHRLRLLEKLCTPGEFSRYFNHELENITASLARVSGILNESNCDFQSLIYNPDFTKRFAETLRRVENVEETLKLYNEQVIYQGD